MGVGCQTRLLFLKPTVKTVQVFSQLLIGLSAGGRGLVAGDGFNKDYYKRSFEQMV